MARRRYRIGLGSTECSSGRLDGTGVGGAAGSFSIVPLCGVARSVQRIVLIVATILLIHDTMECIRIASVIYTVDDGVGYSQLTLVAFSPSLSEYYSSDHLLICGSAVIRNRTNVSFLDSMKRHVNFALSQTNDSY